MKLTREDILALLLLVIGILVMVFGPERTYNGGAVLATIGALGCILSFFFGGDTTP